VKTQQSLAPFEADYDDDDEDNDEKVFAMALSKDKRHEPDHEALLGP